MTYFSGNPARGKRGLTGGVVAVVFAMAVSLGTPAFSQDADLKPLLDRIQRLERDIRTLNAQVARGGGGTPAPLVSGPDGGTDTIGGEPSVARLEVRLTALEDELRAATGRAEEVSHQVDQVNERLDKLIADVDYRLSALESRLSSGQVANRGQPAGPRTASAPSSAAVSRPEQAQPGQAQPTGSATPGTLGTLPAEDMQGLRQDELAAPSGSAPASATAETASVEQAAATSGVLPEGTPREQYNYAFGLLRQTRYEEAEAALGAFLDTHADHPLAGNARYWLGESYYVRGDYVRAAEVFLDAYQGEPKGSKAPDTLLKLGMSLANLDKTREACAAFGKLATEYPDAPTNIKRLVERERSKNACN